MDAKAAQRLQFFTLIHYEKIGRKFGGSVKFSRAFKEPQKLQAFVLRPATARPSRNRRRAAPLEVSCSYDNLPALTLDSGSLEAPPDEELMLQTKTQEIEPYLNGRCIYLVGMMGSGKTTVGKILSQVLSYSFFDSDALVEDELGGTSVAEIFKHYGEGFFRDKESEVLRKLSLMHRRVISTGGGAVVRPINWKYMHKGITVWLDVPLEALARRIAAVGTNSRPLLHYEAGDAYTRALMRLSTLFEERGEAYANANARVSLENIAAKLGCRDVADISPTTIAIEALEQIECFLRSEESHYAGC
ncbi:shikimate kinase 1, chloroplastic [Neltuma alba]|uniref:shikimate kinase 1, chloroplastic n=1 Tax=Neltuma alba TaxID=207710 RepID=UPI0010A45E99|nr:shikimate kinase 1, chloroplastic [Prosopis alba]XP_028765967.1 shikimate kinase 1, chloroplastic [Prosopis alba]XP_028765968.1 shikimate kinase 1, chloroplastic [Prosopis alba]